MNKFLYKIDKGIFTRGGIVELAGYFPDDRYEGEYFVCYGNKKNWEPVGLFEYNPASKEFCLDPYSKKQDLDGFIF